MVSINLGASVKIWVLYIYSYDDAQCDEELGGELLEKINRVARKVSKSYILPILIPSIWFTQNIPKVIIGKSRSRW